MTMIRNFALFALLLFGIAGKTLAQEQDFQAWGGLDITHPLTKKMELSAGYEVRYENNAQQFGVSYFSAGPDYKINKHFSAGIDVRYGTNRIWDRFRYGSSVSYKKSILKLQLSLRARYEYEHYKQAIPEIGQFPAKNNFRLRLEAQYKVYKNIKLFVSSEPQYRIVASDNFLQRVRNIGGVNWEFKKNHEVSLSWYYQPEYNETGMHDFTANIISVNYNWTIPKVKKKKTEDVKKQL